VTDINLHSPPPAEEDVTRPLPHAVGPEKSVLSSILQEPLAFLPLAIEMGVTESHFYLPAHSCLFAELQRLSEIGEEIEFVSLIQKLLDRGKLDRVGGPATITDLYTYATNPAQFRRHVGFLKDKWAGRCIIQNCNAAIAAVYDSPEEVKQTLDALETNLTAIHHGERAGGIVSAREGVRSVVRELEDLLNDKPQVRGIMTGFSELDRMTGGLKPSEQMVIAARPSMGKTSLMMNIVEHIAVDTAVPTTVFSCEMSTHQVMQRLAYARAKIPFAKLREGWKPNKGDLQRIQRAMAEIADAPLWIDDTSAILISEMRAKCRRLHKEGKLQCMAVDYLQLMRSNSKQATGSREREISEISAGLKAIAKDLGIPVIILAQLNRDSEKRTASGGKEKGVPRMSDLRESGSIEQDADYIGLLHRSDYFAETKDEREEMVGRSRLILAKNRNGSTGDIPLTWVAPLMRFENGEPAREQEPQPEMFGNRYGS
jgi:replicative DNA helicase